MQSKKAIKYVYSEELLIHSFNPTVQDRAEMVHELLKSYGLLQFMDILKPKECTLYHLMDFHSSDYLNRIKELSDCSENYSSFEDSEFGLCKRISDTFQLWGFRCPTWNGIFDYMTHLAGATITACEELCAGSGDIILNWTGGWHHAQRDKASGFCYVNDIVLGILTLRNTFDRILYVDLDAHHGDGVEAAFERTKRVFTLSFHQFEAGVFPGTGDCEDVGFVSGKGYAANFPFKGGITGERYVKYFKRITAEILRLYQPQVCVIQCGADVIAGDPLASTNLYPEDLIECIQFLLSANLPSLLLGGVGYNLPNTSRYWTMVTAAICGQTLDEDIPDENEFFLEYGPDYVLQVPKINLRDYNTEEYLESCAREIEDNLRKYITLPV